MSVLIKDMSIPKSCHTCKLMLLSPCQCALTGKSYNWGLGRRPRDCPLVEVSTPHGRLIDADKFAETLKKVSIRQGYDKLFPDNILSVGDVFDAIAADLKGEGLDEYKQAPTVIEAEGSEE